jgi:signal transduction histidine kinase
LHSSKLEYLGIVAAMRGFCKEFGDQQRMEIGFRSHDVPSPLLSPEVALSLFRVLQEALRNAAKHSGVHQVEVQLEQDSGEVHLAISDLGKGFDVEEVKQSTGLGLTSMHERVRLMNGTITIQSRPMAGTTIHVRVPLKLLHGEQQAAG